MQLDTYIKVIMFCYHLVSISGDYNFDSLNTFDHFKRSFNRCLLFSEGKAFEDMIMKSSAMIAN